MKAFIEALGITSVAAFILFAVLAVVLWPFVLIWAVNTLFGLGIAYTFWTWLAALIMMTAFGKTHVKIKQN